MSGTISAGYQFTLGDVQVYYYINNLFPKVSILDFFTDSTQLYPGDVTTSTSATSKVANKPPTGWSWNADNNEAWNADPYLNFNLGTWINDNTDIVLTTEGNYIETIDLFQEYHDSENY